MSAIIGAGRQRVWLALTDPSEVAQWDESIVAPIDYPSTYPFTGQHVRWRFRLGSTQVVLHDRPQEVIARRRLRSTLSLGSLRFDQTYTLFPEPDSHSRTRLAMKIVASSSVPVVGTVVNRFEMRSIAVERIDATLRSVRKWCENNP
jgi:hypothetical protein